MHNKLILSTIAIALGVTAINTGFPDDSGGIVEVKNYSYSTPIASDPDPTKRDPMGITTNNPAGNCFDENGNPAACNYPALGKPRFVYLYCPVDNIVRAVNQFRDDVIYLLGNPTGEAPNPLGDLTTSDPFRIAELSKLNSINLIDGNGQFDDDNIITLPPWKTSADGNTNLEKRTSILNILVDKINEANGATPTERASVISLSPQQSTDRNIAIIKLPSGFTIRNNPWNGGGIPGVDILQDSLQYHINGIYPNLHAVFHVTNTGDNNNNIMDNVKTPYTSPKFNNSRKLFYGVCSGTLSYDAIQKVDPQWEPPIHFDKDPSATTETIKYNSALQSVAVDNTNGAKYNTPDGVQIEVQQEVESGADKTTFTLKSEPQTPIPPSFTITGAQGTKLMINIDK